MKEEKELDSIIKSGLREKIGAIKIEKTKDCPGEAELNDYLEGLLPAAKEKLIAEHVKNCYWCIEQLDQAQRGRSMVASKGKKKMSIGAILISWIKKNAWLIGTAVAFTMSFVYPRYFLQFLILTLLLGIKWIFSTGGTKTVIMIYEALRGRERKEKDSLKSKDRFTV